jgi:demethylmenaquinone methyltransferase/2-methoxy-6-polyprenyl-1,4-benzoquinol methylase
MRTPRHDEDPVALYDRAARYYDKFVTPWERRTRLHAVRELRLRPGASVVLPGCGTGLDLPLVVERVGSAGRVVGLDPSAPMLDYAIEKVNRHGWSNITLLRNDARELSADLLHEHTGLREVDAVLFSYTLSVMDGWESIVERALAVLKHGGRCVIFDLTVSDGALRFMNRTWVTLRKRTGASDPGRPMIDLLMQVATDVHVTRTVSGFAFVASATKP